MVSLAGLALQPGAWVGALINGVGEVFVEGPVDPGLGAWVSDEEPDDHLRDFLGFLSWEVMPEQVSLVSEAGDAYSAWKWEGEALKEAGRKVLRFLGRGGYQELAASRDGRRERGHFTSTYLPEEEQFRQFALFLARSDVLFWL